MNVNCTNETEHVVHYGKAGSAIFLSSFTSLSNAAVIAIVGMRIGSNSNVPLILVLALACTDIGTAFFDFIPATISYFVGFCKNGGQPMCFFHGFIHTFLLTTSHCIVVLMALERFVALSYPFSYNKLVSNKKVSLVLLGCGVYAAIFAMLPLVGFNRVVAHFGAVCFYDWYDRSILGSIYIYWYCVQGFLLIATLLFCNVVVIRELRKMQQRMPNAAAAAKDPSLTKHREFTAYMVVASVVFVVCMTPLTVRTLCNHLGVLQSPSMDYLAVRMNITNSVINPHLFWIFRASARKRLCELIKRMACCCFRDREVDKMQLFNLSSSAGSSSQPNKPSTAPADSNRAQGYLPDGPQQLFNLSSSAGSSSQPNKPSTAPADSNRAQGYLPDGPQTA